MKNVLITGSEGFIGKKLVEYLLKFKKFNVYGLDIKRKKTNNYRYFRSDFEIFSLKNKKKMNFDIIIHLAGIRNPYYKNFKNLINQNLFKSINFFNNLSNRNTKFIFASTEWVYQTKKKVNIFSERFKINVNELNFYSLSKYLFEEYISNNKNFYKSIIVLRLGIITGSKISAVDYLYNCFKNKKKIKINSLSNSRNYISVNDLVVNIERTFQLKDLNILNLTGSESKTLKDVILDLRKKFNYIPKIKQLNKNNPSMRIVRNNKIKSKINFFEDSYLNSFKI